MIQEDASALPPVSGIFTMVSFYGKLIVGLLVMGTKFGNNICHHLDELTLQLFKYYQNLLRFIFQNNGKRIKCAYFINYNNFNYLILYISITLKEYYLNFR